MVRLSRNKVSTYTTVIGVLPSVGSSKAHWDGKFRLSRDKAQKIPPAEAEGILNYSGDRRKFRKHFWDSARQSSSEMSGANQMLLPPTV